MQRVRPADTNPLVSMSLSSGMASSARMTCTYHKIWHEVLEEVFLLPFVIVLVVGHVSIAHGRRDKERPGYGKKKENGIKGMKQMLDQSWVCARCKNYARSEVKAQR